MRIDDESQELKLRISQLSDEELLNMVERKPHEYRKEALDHAKAELAARGIQFQESRTPSKEEPDSTDSTITETPVMRKLTTCKDASQAGLLKGVLSGIGVTCEIRGEYLSMALGRVPFTEYPELWISSDEDFDRAKQIVEEWESKTVEQQESWICKCGEENEGQFSSCWKCGSPAEAGK